MAEAKPRSGILWHQLYGKHRCWNTINYPVHGVARLQVVNGVVSRGTADIDKYMTAAVVSKKKQVRGISVLA
ncbi:hypothetical protein [Endozoicomonas sp. ONNA2]|uniref:hypothetical protein n=1 Tax=Endozoicomonas sp. ONNA2 TaxID=2828741 RepID=UPI0021479D92|nr:hypothetical protein [Endozoicomonas sp. ONNA2]